MASHIIENHHLKIVISEEGAELCSILNKKNNLEYLWQGNKDLWGRRAPVLFPIVGRLYNDTYLYNSQSYTMSQHGFARDKKFDVLVSGERELTFLLTEDEDTLKKYPFPFNLYITYTLSEAHVKVTYEVQNTGGQQMYFSIGGHPGFNCPLENKEKYEDYSLAFEENDYVTYPLKGNYQSNKSEQLALEGKKMPLNTSLFLNDAIIFKNRDIKRIELTNSQNEKKVIFKTDMPYFGIWSPKGSDKFICLEPWNGIADYEEIKELKQKEGIIVLGNGEIHKSFFEITII